LLSIAADEAAAPYDPASDECTDECEAGLDCHMRRFMTSIDAAAEASGQSLAAIKVGTYLSDTAGAQILLLLS